MLTEAEQKVLEAVRKRHIIRKSELGRIVEDALASAKGLVNKGLLQVVAPIGENCYAITQKGQRFAEGKV
ncbi:hypothetical protein D4Q76_02605 [archaeon]|nr:MAG: hypothetical protein D4Q76_02605 [archaeon]